MAIDVECEFIGGPHNGLILTLHQYHCMDALALDISWLKPMADGSVSIVKGDKPRQAEWLGANQAIYEKISPVSGGKATYQFSHIHEVRRCARILEKHGRQCRHDATAGSDYCNTHRAKA